MARRYNPKTQKWEIVKSTSKSQGNNGKKTTKSTKSNLKATTSSKKSSKGSAEKKYNTITYNILEGTLNFIVTKDTIKINPGHTITLKGIGRYLSGMYYVQDVTRQISTNGYSHSATLIKTNFGNSLKSSSSSSTKKKKKIKRKSTRKKTVSKRYHILKRGECLWTVAKKYYGNGAKYTKIAKANNISKAQYRRLRTGLKLIIP